MSTELEVRLDRLGHRIRVFTMDVDDHVEVGQRSRLVILLAVTALAWYILLWSLSILGCVAG